MYPTCIPRRQLNAPSPQHVRFTYRRKIVLSSGSLDLRSRRWSKILPKNLFDFNKGRMLWWRYVVMIPSHDSTPSLPRIGSTNDEDEDVFLALSSTSPRVERRRFRILDTIPTTSVLFFIHYHNNRWFNFYNFYFLLLKHRSTEVPSKKVFWTCVETRLP